MWTEISLFINCAPTSFHWRNLLLVEVQLNVAFPETFADTDPCFSSLIGFSDVAPPLPTPSWLIISWNSFNAAPKYVILVFEDQYKLSRRKNRSEILCVSLPPRKRWNGRIALKSLQRQGNTHRNKVWKFQLWHFSKIRVSPWNVISHTNPYKIQRSTCFPWCTLSLWLFISKRSKFLDRLSTAWARAILVVKGDEATWEYCIWIFIVLFETVLNLFCQGYIMLLW